MQDKYGLTSEEWGKEQFEFEYCAECGGDWDDHDYILILGGWFARCRDENIKKAELDISWKLREQMKLSQLYLKGDKMRSEKTIRKKLIEKTKLLNSMNADIQPYECEHQSGYIQALYWVLNKTV